VSESFAPALTGRRLGVYHVQERIGAGGMGEVYLARDTRLGRDVAIKILPPIFTADPDRLARFEREARVLASLNHPNVGAIYGLEEADLSGPAEAGHYVRGLVLELVDGETLADRLRRGPIPVAATVSIARQIADALDAAHEKGIVHRDLKPANIKVTPDGTVKVLDFGLAKAAAGDGASPDLTHSPTITAAGTREGVILGTAAYMSPEQARGQAVDKRADIWAFGCVLYEMLTGRSAFGRDTVTDTLAAIVEREPDWDRLPASVSPTLRRLLHRCVDKDPKRRLRDIGDAKYEIEAAVHPQSRLASAVGSSSNDRRRRWWAVPVALLGVVLAIVIVGLYSRSSAPVLPETRLEVTTPPTTDPVSLAVSPDGRKIVFVGTASGAPALWLRQLDSGSARPLAGTAGAAFPFWAPDSRSVGFFSDGQLKRIDLAGGSPQTVAAAVNGRGGTWNSDGTIVFTPSASSPLFMVPAAGGEPRAVTELKAPAQASHRFPQFLPDGRHFVFWVRGNPDARGIYVSSLDGLEMRKLLRADSAAVVIPSGHLLFVREGTLFAQRLDLSQLMPVGDPVPVTERLAFNSGYDFAAMSASGTGVLVYRPEATGGERRLTWFDRSGTEVAFAGPIDAATPWHPHVAPDGRTVAVDRTVNGNGDIWVVDMARGLLGTRITTGPSNDGSPVWSPDGSRIAFSSNRRGAFDLYQKPATASGEEELLLQSSYGKSPMDWSADGRFLMYSLNDPKTGNDLWVLPIRDKQSPFPVVNTAFNEFRGKFSPDGKWIAYDSNESGRSEVYVQPFPGPGNKWQVSSGGGAQPQWKRNGRELFFVGLDDRLMAAQIAFPRDGSVTIDGITALFATRIAGGPLPGPQGHQYEVSSDGDRFLINTSTEEVVSPITVILNWKP